MKAMTLKADSFYVANSKKQGGFTNLFVDDKLLGFCKFFNYKDGSNSEKYEQEINLTLIKKFENGSLDKEDTNVKLIIADDNNLLSFSEVFHYNFVN